MSGDPDENGTVAIFTVIVSLEIHSALILTVVASKTILSKFPVNFSASAMVFCSPSLPFNNTTKFQQEQFYVLIIAFKVIDAEHIKHLKL